MISAPCWKFSFAVVTYVCIYVCRYQGSHLLSQRPISIFVGATDWVHQMQYPVKIQSFYYVIRRGQAAAILIVSVSAMAVVQSLNNEMVYDSSLHRLWCRRNPLMAID
jgi:hypothetical protein